MNQIHNPHLPYNAIIPGGIFPGRTIRIQGSIPHSTHKFSVDLLCGSSRDIALHVKPSLEKHYVVRNSQQHGHWGHEEKHGSMPLRSGHPFDMFIHCDPQHYKIAFNGMHFTEFTHRIPYHHVTNIAIEGHITVNLISFEGSAAPSGPMGFVPSAPPHAPLYPMQGHPAPYPAPPVVGAPYPVQPGVGAPYMPPASYPTQPGYAPGYPPAYPTQPGLYPGHSAHATGGHSPTPHKKPGLLDKAGMAVAGALGAASLTGGGHKYNKLGPLAGGGLGAALTGAALTGHLNPKKVMKKQAKAHKKAMKLAGLGLGAGVGAYALHKGVHKLHHGHHHHGRSSSSSSSSSSD